MCVGSLTNCSNPMSVPPPMSAPLLCLSPFLCLSPLLRLSGPLCLGRTISCSNTYRKHERKHKTTETRTEKKYLRWVHLKMTTSSYWWASIWQDLFWIKYCYIGLKTAGLLSGLIFKMFVGLIQLNNFCFLVWIKFQIRVVRRSHESLLLREKTPIVSILAPKLFSIFRRNFFRD